MASKDDISAVVDELKPKGKATDPRVKEVKEALSRKRRNLSDEEFAAQFVKQPSIAGPEMTATNRALLSVFGDTPEEREAAFQKLNPQGQMVHVPSTDIVLFRNSPDENFRKVDKGLLESIAQGTGLVSFGRDLADFAGDLPNIAGEAAGLAVARRPGGGRLVTDLVRLGAGSAAGEGVQQGAQTLAGTQAETLGEQAERATFEGTVSIVGGVLGEGVGRAGQFFAGRTGAGTVPGAGRADRAAERLGAPRLMPSQASDVPAIRLLGRQAQVLLPRINRYVAQQRQRTEQAVRALIDKKARQQFIPQAARALEQANKDIVELATSATRTTTTSFRKNGEALQENINTWWKVSKDDVDHLYTAARAIEEPTFQTQNLKTEAIKTLEGIPVAQEGGGQVRAGAIASELRQVADIISGMPDDLRATVTVDGEQVAAADQLRALRSRLYDLKTPGVGENFTTEHADAARLYSAITRTLQDPTNANPEFLAAWRVADGRARSRFDTIDELKTIDAVRRVTPTRLVQTVVRPGAVDELMVLQRTLGNEGMEPVRNAFKGRLMQDMTKVNQTLDTYDADTLRLLLNEGDEKALRDFGKAAERLAQTKLPQAIEQQTRVRGFISTLIENRESAGVDALFDLMQSQGGKNGAFGKSVRSGIVDEIWARSTSETRDGLVLNSKKFDATIKEFEARGVLKFLSMGEKRVLADANALQRFVDLMSPDAGTSIQAAEAVAGVREVWNPAGAARALTTFIENASIGRLMTSDAGQKLLLGRARNFKGGAGPGVPTDMRNIRLLGAVAATLANDTEDQPDLPREYEFLERSGG